MKCGIYFSLIMRMLFCVLNFHIFIFDGIRCLTHYFISLFSRTLFLYVKELEELCCKFSLELRFAAHTSSCIFQL